MENLVGGKKVTLELVGLDGNAFYLMGAFQRQARKEDWTKEEIRLVLDECRKKDYNHLLVTLMEHCESPENESGEDDE
jgi:hypothetical protein